jgi:hypothetical protein
MGVKPSQRLREERDLALAQAARLDTLGLAMERSPLGDVELADLAAYLRRVATRLDMRAEDEQRKEGAK